MGQKHRTAADLKRRLATLTPNTRSTKFKQCSVPGCDSTYPAVQFVKDECVVCSHDKSRPKMLVEVHEQKEARARLDLKEQEEFFHNFGEFS